MKNKLWLLGLVSATLMAAIVVTKVSQYPNVTTPGTNDFFLLAITNAPATNHNIKYSALKAAINATNVNGSGSASTLAKWSGTNTLASAAIGTGLTFDGTTLSRDAITGDVTTSGDVATIANSAVTDAKVSSSAAIAKSKISTNSTWADADIPSTVSRITAAETLQNKAITSTADGGNNTLKLKNYVVLAFPHTCDGAGAVIATNDNTAKYFGQAAFAGGGAATTNFVEYRLTVPEDLDTAVALKLERFKFRLGAADTNAQSYALTMASVADSASYDSPTLGNSVTLSFAGDASGASGDVETISSVTLTNWAGALTAGQFWVIRLARNGDTDASTQTSYSGPLVISYGISQ